MSDGHEAIPLPKSAVWEFAVWPGPLLFEGLSFALGGALFYVFATALGRR